MNAVFDIVAVAGTLALLTVSIAISVEAISVLLSAKRRHAAADQLRENGLRKTLYTILFEPVDPKRRRHRTSDFAEDHGR